MFKDKSFIGRLITLCLPIALQNLMLASVAATDALMLGALDQDTMAAVSLASQVQFVQNMMLAATVSAFTILAAQYWGKGDREALKKLYFIALRICICISTTFWALCVFAPRFLMLLFTDSEVLISIGVRYLSITGWSYLLTGISVVGLALLKVTYHTKHAAIISISTVLLNIVLNAFFIFGCSMSERGAALATLIARCIELSAVLIIPFFKGFIRPNIRLFFNHDKILIKDYFKCYLPILGACCFWGIGFTSYTAFVGHLGDDAAAAGAVATVVRDMVCCLCDGISAGGGILVGNELGAGNLQKGKLYGVRLMKMSYICGFLSTAIMLIATVPLTIFVKLSDGARSLLWGMMLIMAVYMIGRAVNTVVINGVFSAGGDTTFDLYSLAVCMWGLAIPLAALGTFVFNWPVLIVYACTCLDEVGKIPWVMYHFFKYKWVKNLTHLNDATSEASAPSQV